LSFISHLPSSKSTWMNGKGHCTKAIDWRSIVQEIRYGKESLIMKGGITENGKKASHCTLRKSNPNHQHAKLADSECPQCALPLLHFQLLLAILLLRPFILTLLFSYFIIYRLMLQFEIRTRYSWSKTSRIRRNQDWQWINLVKILKEIESCWMADLNFWSRWITVDASK
jgi:hypothetical protein